MHFTGKDIKAKDVADFIRLDEDMRKLSWAEISTLPLPFLNFWFGILDNISPKLEPRTSRMRLLTTLINILGTEIEGHEVSQGILLTERMLYQEALISQNLKGKKFSLRNLNALRETVRLLRGSILGLTPGHHEQPVLICNTDMPLTIIGATVIGPKATLAMEHGGEIGQKDKFINYTPHQAFKNFTKYGDTIAIWLKPTRSIRIYGNGFLQGHIMKLRDLGGWAVRNVRGILKYIVKRSPETILWGDSIFCLDFFLYPAIAMSELRKGASIFVVSEENFEKMKKRKIVRFERHEFKTHRKANEIGEEEFMVYLEQDGTLVLRNDGVLLATGAYFEGPGGRKKIASSISSDFKSIAIVTSQDGLITFYSPHIGSSENHATKKEKEESVRYVRLDFCI